MISVGILVAGKIVSDMYKSDEIKKDATKKNLKAMNRIAESNINAQRVIEQAKIAMLRCANRKKAILATSMKEFLNTYEKIKEINFTEGDGIKELNIFTPVVAEHLHNEIIVSGQLISEAEVVTSLVVMGLGMFLNPLISVAAISNSILNDAKRNMEDASKMMKKARIVETQAQNISISYEAINERVTRITDILTKMNMLFVKSLSHTDEIISKNGSNKSFYSYEEREALATCINFAVAIKEILDVQLIDNDGKITRKSLEVIQNGENFIRMVKNL